MAIEEFPRVSWSTQGSAASHSVHLMYLRKEYHRYGYGVAPTLISYSFSRAAMQARIGAFIPWSEARAIMSTYSM
jgi:hypothetical protein